ncbi:MAG TPA: phenylalanine--tRNA ligase beta subunit-related protein [Steroidobacteraceae bacterium]|nr:phenylalanine--tRNA ligase beta subunit-related protein [Steroidobacteraceae bacterium]
MSPEVFQLRPDYCALSIVVRGFAGAEALAPAAAPSESPLTSARPDWSEAHMESWRAAYRSFGAKPQRTPCSAEALLRRVEAGGRLPAVNALVDLYNAVSLRYAIPVGGENISAYRGSPRLVRAAGTEAFDTVKDGVAHTEDVPAGEVIWRDEAGATCRRWNWRQGVRTRIDATTRDLWFVLERLEPMPLPALLEAGTVLVDALERMSPEADVETALIDRSGIGPGPGRGRHDSGSGSPEARQ